MIVVSRRCGPLNGPHRRETAITRPSHPWHRMREHVHRVDGGIELQALLDTPSFRSAVEGLGGYSCAETGGRIR
jgi:hypothetical protein